MKIVSYNEMIQQPDGTICAPYRDGKLGDIFEIHESVGVGFLYVKFLKPIIIVKDDVSISWEYVGGNNYYIGEKYGYSTYIILNKNDIVDIISRLMLQIYGEI